MAQTDNMIRKQGRTKELEELAYAYGTYDQLTKATRTA